MDNRKEVEQADPTDLSDVVDIVKERQFYTLQAGHYADELKHLLKMSQQGILRVNDKMIDNARRKLAWAEARIEAIDMEKQKNAS